MRSAFFLIVLACALSSCVQDRVEPKEAIRRSLYVGSTTESYAYSAQGHVTIRGPIVYSGSVVIEGSSKRSGVSAADATLFSERIFGSSSDRIDGNLRVRVPGNGTLYLDISQLSGPLAQSLRRSLSGSTLMDWIRFSFDRPLGETAVPTEESINAQADAFVVTGDRTANGRGPYELDVQFAPGVLQTLLAEAGDGALSGTLWINRDTFVLERALWTVVSLPTPIGKATGQLDVRFTALNAATLPTMPLFTGSVVNLQTLFDTISGTVPISS